MQVAPASGGAYQLNVVNWRDMPFQTVIRQAYDFSCGSAALATLLRFHYGQPVDEATVFRAMWAAGDQAAIRRHGFSLADMKRYLAQRGLGSDGYRVTFERYALARTPAIAVIQRGGYKHFVVIKSVRDGEVLVGDPAIGLHAYPIAEFKKVWDGLVFVIHDPTATPGAHGFDDHREWARITPSPLDPAAHRPDLFPDLQIEDIRTVFQVVPVSVASTF